MDIVEKQYDGIVKDTQTSSSNKTDLPRKVHRLSSDMQNVALIAIVAGNISPILVVKLYITTFSINGYKKSRFVSYSIVFCVCMCIKH